MHLHDQYYSVRSVAVLSCIAQCYNYAVCFPNGDWQAVEFVSVLTVKLSLLRAVAAVQQQQEKERLTLLQQEEGEEEEESCK